MTTTFQASGTHVATTRAGGQIIYQADSIQILDVIPAFIIFFVNLCWGAVITGGNDYRPMMVKPRRVKQDATYGRIGRVWTWEYIKAVLGR